MCTHAPKKRSDKAFYIFSRELKDVFSKNSNVHQFVSLPVVTVEGNFAKINLIIIAGIITPYNSQHTKFIFSHLLLQVMEFYITTLCSVSYNSSGYFM